jgi:hypothetical protein
VAGVIDTVGWFQADANMGGGTNEESGRMAGSGVDLVSSEALCAAVAAVASLGIVEEYEELTRHNWLLRTERRREYVPVGFRK